MDRAVVSGVTLSVAHQEVLTKVNIQDIFAARDVRALDTPDLGDSVDQPVTPVDDRLPRDQVVLVALCKVGNLDCGPRAWSAEAGTGRPCVGACAFDQQTAKRVPSDVVRLEPHNRLGGLFDGDLNLVTEEVATENQWHALFRELLAARALERH